MGANFDYNIIPDRKLKMSNDDIESAAIVIFEKAEYDYGHAGCTGTLAEKSDKGVEIHRERMFNSQDEASTFVQDDLDNDKWGPADAVPIKGVGWFVGGWCPA